MKTLARKPELLVQNGHLETNVFLMDLDFCSLLRFQNSVSSTANLSLLSNLTNQSTIQGSGIMDHQHQSGVSISLFNDLFMISRNSGCVLLEIRESDWFSRCFLFNK